MNNNNYKGISYIAAFFILIGLAMAGLVISSFVTLALIHGDPGALKDPANANLIRGVQTASVLLSMFLPAVLTAWMVNHRPFQLLGFKKEANLRQVGLVVLIVFVALFVAGALGYLNRQIPVSASLRTHFENLEKEYAEEVSVMLSLKTTGGYILSLVLMAFLPALCEECVFRGGLQNFLTRGTRMPWLSILIISIVFSLVHFSYYGFLPRFFLGVVLGLIYYQTGNIWLSIMAHFLNNALSITQVYMLTKEGKGIADAMKEDFPTLYWGFIGIPFLILLFMSLRKTKTAEQQVH